MSKSKRHARRARTWDHQAALLIEAFEDRTGRKLMPSQPIRSQAELEMLEELLRRLETAGPPSGAPGVTVHTTYAH